MKSTAILIAMVGATLGLTAFVAVNQGAPAETDTAERLAALEKRIAGMEKTLESVRDTGLSVKRRVESAPRRTSTANALPSDAAPASASGGMAAIGDPEQAAALEEAVASRVENAVTKKIEQMAAQNRYRGADGKWKPPLTEMAKALSLDPDQEGALRTVFDGARDEAYTMLNERRTEGGSILDQFADDITESGDVEGATKRFFGRITAEKVPGRDQTYLQALMEVEQRVRNNAETHLDEEGRRRFRELNVDVFEVQTGHDPIGDHIRARMGTEE